jgi:hypothetical protein
LSPPWAQGERPLNIELRMEAGRSRRVAIYLLDWDASGRAQTVEVIDRKTGRLIDARFLPRDSFLGGQYLAWDLSGRVLIRVSRVLGPNAVVSGIFLDPSE